LLPFQHVTSHIGVIALAIGLTLLGSRAQAQIAPPGLDVRTVELGAWPGTVAALQTDLRSQGRTLHAEVTAHGATIPCSAYSLALDAAGARAFEIGRCDPRTNATTLRLVDRSALFEPGSTVSRPRAIGIHASVLETADSSGGAATTGGADAHCEISVRPYIDDLEHGTRVYFVPGRFALQLRSTSVTAQTWGDGWLVRGGDTALEIAYDVVDTDSHDVVFHGLAQLVCSSTTSSVRTATSASPSTPPAQSLAVLDDPPAEPVDDMELGGGDTMWSTPTGDSLFRGSCGGAASPERIERVQLVTGDFVMHFTSEFEGAIYLRRARDDGHTELFCRRVHPGHTVTVERRMPPGTYWFFVDGVGGERGAYRYSADERHAPSASPDEH